MCPTSDMSTLSFLSMSSNRVSQSLIWRMDLSRLAKSTADEEAEVGRLLREFDKGKITTDFNLKQH